MQICVYNNYIFENTHVSHWEEGWGAGFIKGECCPAESSNAYWSVPLGSWDASWFIYPDENLEPG